MRNKKKIQPKEVVFQVCMIVLFSIIVLSCIYPFYYIFIASEKYHYLVSTGTYIEKL